MNYSMSTWGHVKRLTAAYEPKTLLKEDAVILLLESRLDIMVRIYVQLP